MNIGLIGLEKSGKTTIFNALTGMKAEVSSFGGQKTEPNISVTEVLDPRVEILRQMYEPKKTVYAAIQFTDYAFPAETSAKGGLFSGQALGMMKTSDAMAMVIRNFSDENMDGLLGPADPLKDLSILEGELLLSDQILVEKRLERIQEDIKRGKKTPALVQEEKVLSILAQGIDSGEPIRNLELTSEDKRVISGFQFLTDKPLFIVLNSGEDSYGKNGAILKDLSGNYPAIEFAGNFEMELSGLSREDAAMFLEEMGITESARSRLTTFAYEILGYISFFTVGKDEVRAWTLRKGETALEAAGTIHSDLARGFIRAECFSYDDLISAGSEKGIREKGLFRLEGKTYIVADGDILNIRFSI